MVLGGQRRTSFLVGMRGIATAPVRTAKVGSGYSSSFVVTGTSPVLSRASGTLPPGLSLSGLTLSGSPTTAGTYRGVLRATTAGGTADTAFTSTVNP